LKSIAPFPVGTFVRLSNGETGIVISNSENLLMRPCVRLAKDKSIIDLANLDDTRSITITEIIG
jgi:hypothetical protein